MKIAQSQLFSLRRLALNGVATLTILTSIFTSVAQNGEELFNTHCATCHKILDNSTGPKLQGVRKKWMDGGASEATLYQWVKNWQVAAASDPYAKSVSEWSPTAMSVFGFLKDEEITAIFEFADNYTAPIATAAASPADGVAANADAEEKSNSWVWIILAIVFSGVILAVGGVRRQLRYAVEESETGAAQNRSYGDELREFIVKNKIAVGIGTVVLLLFLLVKGYFALNEIGVYHNYQPSQPIAFPHSIHSGVNGIDCKYCHNSVEKSKSAGIPSVNVCMNCHKGIQGNTDEQKTQIAKIYTAAGWDTDGSGKYTGKSKPIIWNKVHVLPDHVYFNHQQHVVVGGLDCKQCHGDMTQETTARVVPVEELNKIEGNIPLTRPTLTMGWCIECHGEKEISNGTLKALNSGYYDEIHRRLTKHGKSLYQKMLSDEKVTVKELGGWECAKCHY
jgi:mono/diheme cytochrome c family protein